MTPSLHYLNRRTFLKNVASATLVSPLLVPASEKGAPKPSRISYYRDGEIHVSIPGKPDGKALTTGHWDFKPSWSVTEDLLVCFRRLKNDPVVSQWKTAIFVMHTDGSGFHTLTDGSRTDFNPTWSRDGSNTPIWNRKKEKGGGYIVMQGRVGGRPGEEKALTEPRFHNWAHSCLRDGRILVNAAHPTQGWGVYLLSTGHDGKPKYDPIQWDLNAQGQMHRASISPDEKKICFEYLRGHQFQEPGHILYIGDFDADARTVSNLKAFANPDGKPVWYAYPRWIDGGSAVVYHSTESGKGQLYVHRLGDGSTRCVSTRPKADYRYPHGEAAPC